MAAAAGTRRRIGPGVYLFFFVAFAGAMLLAHASLLRLPYFWDEAGQFIPASLDLFRDGAWIPETAPPELHPPGIMAYLAAAWKLAGCSIPVTRVAMLLLATAGLLSVFLLAIELLRDLPGRGAFLVIAMLFVDPWFFAQGVLAQLDQPAMLFTVLALLFFLQGHIRWSAGAGIVLVLIKETGVVVPVVLGAWLLFENRRREAAWFAIAPAALAGWIAILTMKTGHWTGTAAFADYNFWAALHPAHIAAAALRRVYFLFVANTRWIATAAIVYAWRRRRIFSTRAWKISWLVFAAQTAAVTVFGGAVLNRYLLPALPILYSAAAAAFTILPPRIRVASAAALLVGLAAGNRINPPYPFPYEDNLAFADFVRLQCAAADFLDRAGIRSGVYTTWPLSGVLTRPDLGYVNRPVQTVNLPGYSRAALASLEWRDVRALVAYSRDWDPPFNLVRRLPFTVASLPTRDEIRARVPFPRALSFERRGQWLDIYVRPD